MNFNNKVDLIKNNLKKKRFENELNYLTNETKNNQTTEETTNRIGSLTKIIELIEKENMNANPNKGKDKYFEEIDKYIYKKPWNRLNNYHKIVKIKEFIKTEYPEIIQDKLLKEISQYAEDGKLNTKKHVEYDPKTESIKKIYAIKFNKLDNSYIINL